MNETAPVDPDAPGRTPDSATSTSKAPRIEELERLQPSERRYDVALEDDFAMSVHPNGIKTWVFVYEHNGRLRRRTLGVFPDMPPRAARRALRNARDLRHTFDDAPPPRPPATAADRRRTSLSGWLLSTRGVIAIVSASLLVAAAAGLLVLAGLTGPAVEPPGDAAVAGATDSPGRSNDAPPADAEPGPRAVPPRENASPALSDASLPAEETSAPLADASLPAEETSAPLADASLPAEDASTPLADASPPAGVPTRGEEIDAGSTVTGEAPPAADALIIETPDPLPANSGTLFAGAMRESTDAPDANRPGDADSDTLLTPDVELRSLATLEGAADPALSTEPGEPAGKAPSVWAADWRGDSEIFSETVYRAVLTSSVENREPGAPLGAVVIARPNGVARVFYFTEFRNMGGRSVRYRWVHEGSLIADVPITIGEAWRWRSYSQKDILAARTGRWEVSVVDDAGAVLARTGFELRTAP